MRVTLMLIIFTLFCNSGHTQYDIDSSLKNNGKEHIGLPFPDFAFSTIDSTLVSKSSLKGKVVFINFWQTEWPPCIAEFNALNILYEEFKSNKDFEFLSLTYDSPSKIQKMRLRFPMPYRIATVKFPKLAPLKMGGFPTSAIIDRYGKIIYWVKGGYSDPERALQLLKEAAYPILHSQLMQ
jgi:peroxiredoxin